MSSNADKNSRQDVIANRLIIHMVWAFLTAVTMMYFNNYYTNLGVIEGMTVVSTAARVLFFVALGLAVVFAVTAFIMYKKGVDFSQSAFAPAATVGWPIAYMLFMCPLTFSPLWFWDFSDVFKGTYIIIGTFLALYLINYLCRKDLFLVALSLVASEVSFYILSRLILGLKHGRAVSIVYCVLSAAVGVLYIVRFKALSDNKGRTARGNQLLARKAIYFPAYILGGLHIAGNLACIVFGYGAVKYTCYALAVYAVVVGIIYLARKLYKK